MMDARAKAWFTVSIIGGVRYRIVPTGVGTTQPTCSLSPLFRFLSPGPHAEALSRRSAFGTHSLSG